MLELTQMNNKISLPDCVRLQRWITKSKIENSEVILAAAFGDDLSEGNNVEDFNYLKAMRYYLFIRTILSFLS